MTLFVLFSKASALIMHNVYTFANKYLKTALKIAKIISDTL